MIKVMIENSSRDNQGNAPIEGDISLVAVLKERKTNADEKSSRYAYQTNLQGCGSTEDVLFLGVSALIASWRQAAADILKEDPEANLKEMFLYIIAQSQRLMEPLAQNLYEEIKRGTAERDAATA